MKLEIFTVYDSKAKAYLPPFFLPMVGQATRVFQNAANDPTHSFGANPGDYTLFHIGVFDDDNGTITNMKAAQNLGIAQEFKDAPKIPEPQFDLVDEINKQEAN